MTTFWIFSLLGSMTKENQCCDLLEKKRLGSMSNLFLYKFQERALPFLKDTLEKIVKWKVKVNFIQKRRIEIS